MTLVKLRYIRLKNGNLFWEPTPEMRKLGFLPRPLGPNGPESQEKALALYQDWLKASSATKRVTDWPPGSFGAYYDRFRRTKAWGRKAARTREDYERAWKHLEPRFARRTATAISAADCEDFYEDMERQLSPSERYRTIKVLRALLADMAVRLELNRPSPASTIANPQPRGRSAIWLAGEIEQLAWGAALMGHRGMAVAIRIAWDSLFSPVDVWSLKRASLKQDRAGWYVERARTKTEKGAFGSLSPVTAQLLFAYLEWLGVTIKDDAPVLRQRNGHGYRSKDTFGDDFRSVRQTVFPGDTRQFLDIRRSGSVEADAAGADKGAIGEILANGLASNAFLEDTYTPPTVAKARLVAEQRAAGRERLKAELERVSHSKSGPRALTG